MRPREAVGRHGDRCRRHDVSGRLLLGAGVAKPGSRDEHIGRPDDVDLDVEEVAILKTHVLCHGDGVVGVGEMEGSVGLALDSE